MIQKYWAHLLTIITVLGVGVVISVYVGRASPPYKYHLPDARYSGETYIVDPPVRMGDLVTIWGPPRRAVYSVGYTVFAWDRKRAIVFGVARPGTQVEVIAYVAEASPEYPCIKELRPMSPYAGICIYTTWVGFKTR